MRLAACEPCRRLKTACGHERPSCARCVGRGQSSSCFYRARPFSRRNPERLISNFLLVRSSSQNTVPPSPHADTHLGPGTIQFTESSYRYPNPGFLGISSHSTIFDQVPTATAHSEHVAESLGNSTPFAGYIENDIILEKGSKILMDLTRLDMGGLLQLLELWLASGSGLPLANLFIPACANAVSACYDQLRHRAATSQANREDLRQSADHLTKNTRKPIMSDQSSVLSDISSQMISNNTRWETLGIFFTGVTRACTDIQTSNPLYESEKKRRVLIRTLILLSDRCLELCLGLDTLNDLQLILQYENMIAHSQVDGDQSYNSWRRVGDTSSSLFALGYHEKIDKEESDVPQFLKELRKSCFARIYTADKMLAIFLGRPPRIVKGYCYFQVPEYTIAAASHDVENHSNGSLRGIEIIDYTAETRCSALFAYLKEDALQLFRSPDNSFRPTRASEIREQIEEQWRALPDHFRLGKPLREHVTLTPFERDFLAGIRLEFLHTLFLLDLSSGQRISVPDEQCLEIAVEMLSLVTEVIILRDRLANSGTSLIWKVGQYGLPAAGVVSLALLGNIPMTRPFKSPPRSRMLQNLSVLVSEITIGTWIQAGDPNYALFIRATQTIQSLLDSATIWEPRLLPDVLQASTHQDDATRDWDAHLNPHHLDFELNFWANLAGHPALANQSTEYS